MFIGLNSAITGLTQDQLSKTINSLFSKNEQGVWYDPSDLSTLYQDAAGTIPVTAVEQPVGRMLDKSGRGNHATQTTSTSRPVLSARYNLLTKTEQFDDAAWVKTGPTVMANAEEIADKVVPSTLNKAQILTQGNIAVLPNTTYKVSIKAKKAGYRYFYFAIIGAPTAAKIFDFDIGAYTTSQIGTAYYESQLLSDGFYLLTMTFTTGSGVTSVAAEIGVRATSSFATFAGDGVSGALVKDADLRVANESSSLPAYQRVNTATDYDTAGFKPYLRFDGVDDYLSTGSIDFSSTDKMTVFAGVRKLSDAAGGFVAELSAERAVNNGAWSLIAPGGTGVRQGYYFSSKGTLDSSNGVDSGFAPPITNVLTGIGDISGDSAILRVDGTQAASSTADQGTGNYGNYPLYIGRRGGTSLPFNGQLYGLVIRGALSSTGEIQGSESYMNLHTGAY